MHRCLPYKLSFRTEKAEQVLEALLGPGEISDRTTSHERRLPYVLLMALEHPSLLRANSGTITNVCKPSRWSQCSFMLSQYS